jgi:hypothetical protein
MFARLPDFGDAFALRITLRGIEPAIWRTVIVPAEMSLGELHEVLQIVFGWQNSHLHDFEVSDIRFGMVDVEDELFAVDEHAAPLGAVAREGSRFTYRYDFGDDWEHDVAVESVIANGAQGIVCSGGARACPPEDCGGAHGYANVLGVLANPDDDEFASMKKWVGRRFDPERFDIAAVNKRLATFSKRLARAGK